MIESDEPKGNLLERLHKTDVTDALKKFDRLLQHISILYGPDKVWAEANAALPIFRRALAAQPERAVEPPDAALVDALADAVIDFYSNWSDGMERDAPSFTQAALKLRIHNVLRAAGRGGADG